MQEKSRGRPVQEGRWRTREGGSWSFSLFRRGEVDARLRSRLTLFRVAGRDFTGVRRSSEGGRSSDTGQDSFHTIHYSGEHASFAGKPYSGEPQSGAVKRG